VFWEKCVLGGGVLMVKTWWIVDRRWFLFRGYKFSTYFKYFFGGSRFGNWVMVVVSGRLVLGRAFSPWFCGGILTRGFAPG
jgi:hypothetical protein